MVAVARFASGGITERHREWFQHMLPLIQMFARRAAKRLPPHARAEFMAEAIANAYVAFCRLVERGRDNAIHATPLARYAIAHVRAGRQVGCRLNSGDVMSVRAQRMRGFGVASLDADERGCDSWRDTILEDRRASPADTAAFRLDFAAWLEKLPPRERQIAEELALHHSTQEVATRFGISPGRISQLRRKLESAWEDFQGGEGRDAA